jgi:hypothetical protein
VIEKAYFKKDLDESKKKKLPYADYWKGNSVKGNE